MFGIFGGRRGPAPLRPDQQMNRAELQEEKVDEVVSKQDARYDSMTPEEREKYYMKPSFMTRVKKSLRGQ